MNHSCLPRVLKFAFAGKMGVGKDTAANYLARVHQRVHRMSFATPLYEILTYAQTKAGFEVGVKDRAFLQWVGTEWARQKDKDVWVNAAIRDLNAHLQNVQCLSVTGEGHSHNDRDRYQEPDEIVCVCDVRFENEFDALKNEGFTMVKIVADRPDMDLKERAGTGTATHSSEKGLDHLMDHEWDFIVYNNNHLENFYTQIEGIYQRVLALSFRNAPS